MWVYDDSNGNVTNNNYFRRSRFQQGHGRRKDQGSGFLLCVNVEPFGHAFLHTDLRQSVKGSQPDWNQLLWRLLFWFNFNCIATTTLSNINSVCAAILPSRVSKKICFLFLLGVKRPLNWSLITPSPPFFREQILPSRVLSKTLKMISVASPHGTQH